MRSPQAKAGSDPDVFSRRTLFRIDSLFPRIKLYSRFDAQRSCGVVVHKASANGNSREPVVNFLAYLWT